MQAVVPTGIGVRVDGDMVWFDAAGRGLSGTAGTYACQWLDKGTGTHDDLIVEACWRALDDLEDFVDEATTEPWPAEQGTPPRPAARIEGRVVHLWFGEAERPVLELEPIPLAPEV
jgi:hypothetical protein